jgi:hypothetical protein
MNDPADEPSAAALINTLSPKAAKILATEVLLADPESLGDDDVLEACLYLLRERLTGGVGSRRSYFRRVR